MEPYRLLNKLDYSKDSNKYMALKYDAGKIKTEKYGDAILSGHLLVMARYGEFPSVHAKEMEEKACVWLNEMGLEECQDMIIDKTQIPRMMTHTAPGVDPEKLELYFKFSSFAFFLDDGVTKLKHLNKKDVTKQKKDVLKLVESLVSIIRSHGSGTSTEAAISNLNSTFKNACIALSHICRYGFKHMCKDHYKILARELMDFIRVNKWIEECHNSPYNENEYLFWRLKDVGLRVALESVYFAKDICISDEIRMHPLFQRFIDMLSTHATLVNDIFSLQKETVDDEPENIVLIKCKKFNLQKSIYKTEKAANKLIFELKKCATKLSSYFPSNNNLKNLIKTIEFMVDGHIYWYQDSRRYGDIKFEKYEVEYDCDYNSWLKDVCAIGIENMKEPTLSE